MKKPSHPNFTPSGLRRADAAQYCGVSASYFDTLVERGVMPRPKLMGENVKIWLRTDIDNALYCLPEVESQKPYNPCDRLFE